MSNAMFTATATIAALGLALHAGAASATDLVNQDEIDYTLTLTDDAGSHTVEIASATEILDACEGCTITLEGIDPITASAHDVVVIIDGTFTVQE
ncbi:MAG: hypothetical protein NUV50_01860 [Rhodospirillales bacterium]|nr:hypothetical protein [Rhodospirillales bacterium]